MSETPCSNFEVVKHRAIQRLDHEEYELMKQRSRVQFARGFLSGLEEAEQEIGKVLEIIIHEELEG